MNNSGSKIMKPILWVLAVVCVVLIVVFTVKAVGAVKDDDTGLDEFDMPDTPVVVTSTDISDSDIIIEDDSTVEMDTISSSTDAPTE